MPIENNFQHDELSRKNPGERVGYAQLAAGPAPDSPLWRNEMSQCAGRLHEAGVRAVVFFHGVIHGSDVFGMQRLDEAGGLKRGYSRGVSGVDALLAYMREGNNGIPPLAGSLKPPFAGDDKTRQVIDSQVGDAGNFTDAYVTQCRSGLNSNPAHPITVVRRLWSCEHFHLGRLLASLRLLGDLRALCESQSLKPDDRILVLAHGQSGLVTALASNFLCPSPIVGRSTLLRLIATYAERNNLTDVTHLLKILEPLFPTGSVLHGVTLDIVTLGTPVRYGWDPSGIGKLLHVVNHRQLRSDGKAWLSKMELPQITMEMPIAWGGDYVQELAVAGSDSMPPTEQAKAANKAVWELVEPYDGFERWLECARRAVRIPSEGHGLLIDYQDSTGSANPRDHYYGHAVYTRRDIMLFNLKQIIDGMYRAAA
ncbi:hypothetical protein W02_21700 [Nitrospira sp. KM1]|uniref:hypothetical protein n=1 Tax=Nitrospira sp. KM1 TaxID=1936990 RepID=UPI0013A71C0E|nr:hypothetical protein [Nitrospira sp. KM1]BCA55030.1 hypothetical protein W02_21700 [Nitrospira sp. KM1]